MKIYVCAVFDSALQAFANPIFVPSTGLAVRSFTDEVNRSDSSNPMNKHPSDFEIYSIAEYDDSTGLFLNNEPSLLARGKDVLVGV
jgi:hypothetical protein